MHLGQALNTVGGLNRAPQMKEYWRQSSEVGGSRLCLETYKDAEADGGQRCGVSKENSCL